MTLEHLDPNEATPDDVLDRQVRVFLAERAVIQAHVRSLVRDGALADDVFQEVWLRFERATRKGEVIEQVVAWCRAAARLVALENWRKQGREVTVEDEALAALVDRAYEEQEGREDHWQTYRAALAQCLDELPQRSRELVTRFYRKRETITDMAPELGRSAGSIKTALCRIRQSLAKCVRRRAELHP